MPTERLFLDIRYYESDCENVFGSPLPGSIGRIYSLPKSINALGARIARKLREHGFVAGVFSHLYANFTTALPEGQCHFSPRAVEDWFKYVDFGLVPEKTNLLSDTDKELLVCRSTFDILRYVSGERPERRAIADRVAAEIAEIGSELEIVHKTKETGAYAVTVTYQIRPNGNQSVALIEYRDKKSGQRLKSRFITLWNYEDIFFLVGSISVSRGIISLKPRASFKAGLFTQRYQVPIEIPIAGLDAL